MLDAVLIERSGIPTAVVGAEKLLSTTGQAMAKAQGLPGLPFAYIDHSAGIMTVSGEPAENMEVIRRATEQIERILVQAAPGGGVEEARD